MNDLSLFGPSLPAQKTKKTRKMNRVKAGKIVIVAMTIATFCLSNFHGIWFTVF